MSKLALLSVLIFLTMPWRQCEGSGGLCAGNTCGDLDQSWDWKAEMARTETHSGGHSSTVRLLGLVLKTTATAIAALKTWQRTVSGRRAIANLTADQLRDIGHAEAPAPVL